MSTRLEAGSELAGYRVERLLGQGGMGVVYLARDVRLDRPVALKVVRAELAGDPRFRDWFLQETQLAAGLDHPSSVPVYGAGEDDGVLYLAMRYVDGRSLRDALRNDGAFAPDRTLRILGQVAAALDAAHAAGLVHRDVKPANVLLAGDPARGTEHAYLADFGLAKRPATADSVTGSGALLGTIAYAAPEQIEGAEVDGRADIYSLGCLLFECLTGRPPFTAHSDLAVVYAHLQQPPPQISTISRGLPPALDPVIAKALAKKPADRYRTARELLDAARGAFPGSVIARGTRRPLIAAAGLAVVGVAALGVAAFVADSRSSGRGDQAAAATNGDGLVVLDARTGRRLHQIVLQPESAPSDVAVAGGMAYVANPGTGTINQYDGRTGSPVHAIRAPGVVGFATGDGTVRAVLHDAAGTRLRLIDGTVGELTEAVELPQAPLGSVALSRGWAWFPRSDGVPLGGLMRVATDGSGRAENVPIAENTTLGPVVTDAGGVLALTARLPDGMQEGVLRADAARGVTVLASMAHLGDPFGVGGEALTVARDAIWSLGRDGTVWKIDPDGHGLLASRKLAAGVWTSLAASRSGIWVGDVQHGAIVRLDPTTLLPGRPVAVGGAPTKIWADGDTIYVATTPIRAAAQPAGGAAARGTLRIVSNGDIDYWDGTSFLWDAWNIEAVTCNALLDYASPGDQHHTSELIPGVAASLPTVSRDRRTYTFRIRTGLQFSDHTPVTPADVVGTYLRSLSPEAGFDLRNSGYFDDIAGARSYEQGKAKAIAGITHDGDRVSFRLNHPDAAFPDKTALRPACIVPGATARSHTDKSPPTTGPFVILSRTPGRSLVLVPNPVWPNNQKLLRNPSPRGVQRIEVTFGMLPADQVAAIAAGRADLSAGDDAFWSPAVRRLLGDRERAGHVAVAQGGFLSYLALNVHHGPFAQRAVRQAANLAVDRTRVAAAYPVATSRPWSQYVTSTVATSSGQPYPAKPDVAAANRLLRQSGIRLPIPVSLWYPAPKPEVALSVSEVKRDLDEAGFQVTLRPVWGPFYFDPRAQHLDEMDMAFSFFGPDFADAAGVIPPLFGADQVYNPFGYRSSAVDREIRRLERAPDTPSRTAAWGALADRIARRDAPIVVLGDWMHARLHSDRVRNVVVNTAKFGPDLSQLQLGP